MTATEATVGGRRAEREAAKKRRARRGQAIAAVSSLIVIGGLVALAVTSPGWTTFRDTFFSWSAFKDSFPDVARAFWLDVKMFCVIEVAVLIVGLVIALVRTSRAAALFPLRALSAVFVDVFRGVPVIILIYLVGFGIPALELSGLPSDPIVLGGIALTLSYSAYVAEVYRAGIGSIHRGQRDAALAIGLTEGQALRRVISAGGAAGRPAAPERLHLPPEGRRPRLDPRGDRGLPRGADHHLIDLQLHPAGGRAFSTSA